MYHKNSLILKSRSLPILIIIFIAFIGLICSPSISFLSSNYGTRSYQAFAAEDYSVDDSSSSDDSSRDSFAGDSRGSSTGSFDAPPVEAPPVEAPPVDSSSPPTEAPPTEALQPEDIANPQQPDTQPSGGDKSSDKEATPIDSSLPPDNIASPPPDTTADIPLDTQPSSGDKSSDSSTPPANIASSSPHTTTDSPLDTQPSSGDSPPSDSSTLPDAGGGASDDGTPDSGNEGDGIGLIGIIPPSPTSTSDKIDSKEGKAAARQSQLVKEHGSFDDTLQDNTFDGGNGIITRDGTIIHNGKVTGHTKVTCGVNSQVPGCGPNSKATDLPKFQQPIYESSPPPKSKLTPTKAQPHSVGRGGSGTPNIKIVDNRQQEKVIVKVNTKVDTVTKNFITNNIFPSISSSQGKQKQPTFLLLLDTAQLCQIAGDVQCAVKQDQFKTFNLVTKLDSTGKTWSITGQTKNIASQSKSQGNVQVTGYFYDSKGNNVGGSYKGAVNPGVLKSLQSGVFNFKASTSAMKGTPSFLRLEYQSTGS